MAETQYGLPLILDKLTESPARGLERIGFETGDDHSYNEKWLQKLVSRYPNVLPIEQLEPALTPAISICMELPLASGFVDNFYATPDGDLIVGETKLFRNPGARREVVGQVMEYAKALSALSYENLEEAILKAEAPDGNGGHPKVGLYDAVASAGGREGMQEQLFIDAVSHNLERGRFLLLVIGDGIRSGTENIATFLQQHAGMHFTFGLIELAIFKLPTDKGGFLVQPRILARTKNIDRGIVTLENGRITAKPPANQSIGSKEVSKRSTITEEKFYEELAAHSQAIARRLKDFLPRLEGIGISIEFGKGSMILRWRSDEKRAWNLGTITTSGKVWTELLNGQADAVGLLDVSHAYLRQLATLIPGASVKENPKPTAWYVAKGGTYITIDELLNHADGWLAAIQEFMRTAGNLLKDDNL